MKRLFLLSLLLFSCVRFTPAAPWKQPDPKAVTCNSSTCCYPYSNRTQMCVTNGINSKDTIIYYLVIEH